MSWVSSGWGLTKAVQMGSNCLWGIMQLGRLERFISGCTFWFVLNHLLNDGSFRDESVSCTEWVLLISPFVVCCRTMEAWAEWDRTLQVEKNPPTPTRGLENTTKSKLGCGEFCRKMWKWDRTLLFGWAESRCGCKTRGLCWVLVVLSYVCVRPGFGWDRVTFLHRSWCGAVLWI